MEQQRTSGGFADGREPLYTTTSDERTLGTLSHALTFASTFLAPLIIYLIKKDDSKFVADNAKESLNFQITVFIACIALTITGIGILLILPVYLAAVVLVIIASIRASEGKVYNYPLTIRFIK